MGGEKWAAAPVSDLCQIYLGGTPRRSEPSYWDGTIKWATAADVANCYTRYLENVEQTITERGLAESAAKLLPRNTIVITARGTVGALCMLSEPMTFNQTCYGLVAKEGIMPGYLYYALKAAVSQINSLSYGTVFDTITMESFNSLNVPVPPAKEQQAIACTLGALDDKIELNRQMNQTLEAMARAIFKSWFVGFNPVRAKAAGQQPPGLAPHIAELFPDSFVESELGKIPRGWQVVGLSEVARFLNGLPLQKFPPVDGRSLPVIKIAQLRKGSTNGADKASADIDPIYVLEDGDVLFSWSGSLECILWCGGRGALNQHLFKVTSDCFPKWFYYLWIDHHIPWFRHIAEGKATTMGHIQRYHLAEARVFIPPPAFLSMADTIMAPLVTASILRSLECRKLTEMRDSLLPKLISGELPIPDAERIVGRCI